MNAFKANNILKVRAQELQEKLYLAAKKSKTRRFHQYRESGVFRLTGNVTSWSSTLNAQDRSS
jgi:hypothetical protein